jgi:streptothricin acetyltransferase
MSVPDERITIESSPLTRESLAICGSIPIAFRVEAVLEVQPVDGGLAGLKFVEEPVRESYVKDYDEYEDEAPVRWLKRFDTSHWVIFIARAAGEPVGTATVAFRSPTVWMLEGRDDLAVLWDIRVHPEHRGKGIGSALFRAAALWAREQGCRRLKVETQSINVPACRFYAKQGCRLRAIDREAYAADPRVAHEAMLLWSFDLKRPDPPRGGRRMLGT